jgi:hypothetical protein
LSRVGFLDEWVDCSLQNEISLHRVMIFSYQQHDLSFGQCVHGSLKQKQSKCRDGRVMEMSSNDCIESL